MSAEYKEVLTGILEELAGVQMMFLNTRPAPKGLTVWNIKTDYLNIDDTILNKDSVGNFEMPFGTCCTIQRALDYAVYSTLPVELLMEPSVSQAKLKKLGGKRKYIPNYWAYLGYVMLEKITQCNNIDELIETSKELIDVKHTHVKTALGEKVAIVPNNSNGMYLGIARVIVDVVRDNLLEPDEVKHQAYREVLSKLKKKPSLDVMAKVGVDVSIG